MSGPMRCLWISRNIPFPLNEGARVYSANLAQSLAQSGALVRFLGFGDANTVPKSASAVEWLPVPGKRRGRILATFSSWPIAAAIDATEAYGALLEEQLREQWDAVVLDTYATGWALDRCVAYRNANRAAVLVHVSSNHEEMLWRAMAREAHGSDLRRWMLRRNARKVGALERRIVQSVDLLTTITAEDRRSLGAVAGQVRVLTLTPGFNGWVAGARRIVAATPRRVIILGSFHWIVKQENIANFVRIADPIFKERGIELDVVGEMPPSLLVDLRARCLATRFHGFMADVAPLLSSSRIAIVHESIGGGFKLKFLDYIFARVPVAAVSQAVAGLSDELQRAMLTNSSQAGLIDDIVLHIDRIDQLNQMQERAFALGNTQFQWSDRGEQFRQALLDVRQQPASLQVPGALGAIPSDIDLTENKRCTTHA
jgi:polysaccharide biosynthesis protein PslH